MSFNRYEKQCSKCICLWDNLLEEETRENLGFDEDFEPDSECTNGMNVWDKKPCPIYDPV
jgi:hypothetical protein